MTDILAIDLGKFKSVACLYQASGAHAFRTLTTTPAALHEGEKGRGEKKL